MSNKVQIKNHLHSLIDSLDNTELLEMIYEILDSQRNRTEKQLMSELTEEQKNELYQSYEDSDDETNLIEVKDVRAIYLKWLEK